MYYVHASPTDLKPQLPPTNQHHSDAKQPAALLEPAATLCHLHGTPFFVLPKATSALGAALGLQRAAALGFRKSGLGSGPGGADGGGLSGEGSEGGEEVEGVRARVASFLEFVLAKREFMTNAPPVEPAKEAGEGSCCDMYTEKNNACT